MGGGRFEACREICNKGVKVRKVWRIKENTGGVNSLDFGDVLSES